VFWCSIVPVPSITSGVVTVEIDRPLHRLLKIACAEAGVTMREFVARTLYDRLGPKAKKATPLVPNGHSPAPKRSAK